MLELTFPADDKWDGAHGGPGNRPPREGALDMRMAVPALDDLDGAQRPGLHEHAAAAVFHRDQELLDKLLSGSKSSGSGSAQGEGAADACGGNSGAKSSADLRAGLDKVKKKDFAILRKKRKGKGISTTIEFGKALLESRSKLLGWTRTRGRRRRVVVRLVTAVMVALQWLRAGDRLFFAMASPLL